MSPEPESPAGFANRGLRRVVVEASIELRSPLHLGSGKRSLMTDALVQRDRRGRFLVPGQSLAGVLRAITRDVAPWLRGARPHVDEEAEPCTECALWGSEAAASSVLVRHAGERLAGPATGQAHAEIRDNVGIDRQRGAQVEHTKHDREVVPRGTVFDTTLRLDDPPAEVVRVLAALLGWLGQDWAGHIPDGGRLALGGRGATGLGQAVFRVGRIYDMDLAEMDTLVPYIESDAPEPRVGEALTVADLCEGGASDIWLSQPHRQEWAGTAPSSRGRVLVVLDLRVDDPQANREDTPLLVASVADVAEAPRKLAPEAGWVPAKPHGPADLAFVHTRTADGTLVPYVPGSSLRGALRSRAELILRTIASASGGRAARYLVACDPLHGKESCGPRLAPLKRWPEETPEEFAARIEGLSCLACRVFGSSAAGGRVVVGEAYPAGDESPSFKIFDHNALDRFTSASRALYSTRPAVTGCFRTEIELRDCETWQLGLLALCIKDLVDGDLPVGYGQAKGYGFVRAALRRVVVLAAPGSDLEGIVRAVDGASLDRVGPYLRLVSEVGAGSGADAAWPLLEQFVDDLWGQVEARVSRKVTL